MIKVGQLELTNSHGFYAASALACVEQVDETGRLAQ